MKIKMIFITYRIKLVIKIIAFKVGLGAFKYSFIDPPHPIIYIPEVSHFALHFFVISII